MFIYKWKTELGKKLTLEIPSLLIRDLDINLKGIFKNWVKNIGLNLK